MNLVFLLVISLVLLGDAESGAIPGIGFFLEMVGLNLPRPFICKRRLYFIHFCVRNEQCCLVLNDKVVIWLI